LWEKVARTECAADEGLHEQMQLQEIHALREPLIRRASRATFSHKGRRKSPKTPNAVAKVATAL
jgi:hypothetical protein